MGSVSRIPRRVWGDAHKRISGRMVAYANVTLLAQASFQNTLARASVIFATLDEFFIFYLRLCELSTAFGQITLERDFKSNGYRILKSYIVIGYAL